MGKQNGVIEAQDAEAGRWYRSKSTKTFPEGLFVKVDRIEKDEGAVFVSTYEDSGSLISNNVEVKSTYPLRLVDTPPKQVSGRVKKSKKENQEVEVQTKERRKEKMAKKKKSSKVSSKEKGAKAKSKKKSSSGRGTGPFWDMLRQGTPISEISKKLGQSYSTVYSRILSAKNSHKIKKVGKGTYQLVD